MFDMHSNVPCIFRHPATKHITHSSGRHLTYMAAMSHAAMPAAESSSRVRLVKRNLVRNSTGNVNAMPHRPE